MIGKRKRLYGDGVEKGDGSHWELPEKHELTSNGHADPPLPQAEPIEARVAAGP